MAGRLAIQVLSALAAVAAVAAVGLPSTTLAAPVDCTDKLPPSRQDGGVHPIVVLLAADPWADVIGSDSPRLALYDDGMIIFRTSTGYRSARLSPQETATFQTDAGIGALACERGNYSLTNAYDQPMNYFFVGRGGDLARIGVYGRIEAPAAKTSVPDAVRSAYNALRHYDRRDASQWLPEKIEVMLSPYERASEPSIVWPSKWPTTRSEGTLKRGDSFSVYVSAGDYDELVAFLKTRTMRGAVEMDGKKWAANIRLPFPEEGQWLRPPAD